MMINPLIRPAILLGEGVAFWGVFLDSCQHILLPYMVLIITNGANISSINRSMPILLVITLLETKNGWITVLLPFGLSSRANCHFQGV